MYDNLSLIYESSLRPNIIRQDVLESCVLLIRENKNTQVQYYVENILTFAFYYSTNFVLSFKLL